MKTVIPSSEELRLRLAPLTIAELDGLAARCGVPVGTITKIRNGQTSDPRIETVRKLAQHLPRKPRGAT